MGNSLSRENRSHIDSDYLIYVKTKPYGKFILYLRIHPFNSAEKEFLQRLQEIFGNYKELPNEVEEFIDVLNSFDSQIYLSFIQSEEELIELKNSK